MESKDSSCPTPPTEKTCAAPQANCARQAIVKVHIGAETFYCNPLPLKKNSRFFARALAGSLKEIPLPPTDVSAGAFCALYGWLSGENTPFATHRALDEVPIAAEYLGIIPPMDKFWVHQHFHQLRKIKERMNGTSRESQ